MDKANTNGKTVAEHVVDFLERREISHVFGLCGHTNIAVLRPWPTVQSTS